MLNTKTQLILKNQSLRRLKLKNKELLSSKQINSFNKEAIDRLEKEIYDLKMKRYTMEHNFQCKLNTTAQYFQKNTPRSEKWFYKQIRDLNFPFYKNEYSMNKIYGKKYIPDIINKKRKFLIEIDDPSHSTEQRILKDQKRDHYFGQHGFKTVRIKAYDHESLMKGLRKIASCVLKHCNLNDHTDKNISLQLKFWLSNNPTVRKREICNNSEIFTNRVKVRSDGTAFCNSAVDSGVRKTVCLVRKVLTGQTYRKSVTLRVQDSQGRKGPSLI